VIGSKYKPLVIAWSTRKFSAWRVYSPSQHVIRLFFLNDSCRIGVSRNVALTMTQVVLYLRHAWSRLPWNKMVISLCGSYAWSTVGSGPRSRCAGPQHCRKLMCLNLPQPPNIVCFWHCGYVVFEWWTTCLVVTSPSLIFCSLPVVLFSDSLWLTKLIHSTGRFLGQLITIRCYTEQFRTLEKI